MSKLKNTLLTQAVKYARKGYHVIPLFGITKGQCDCWKEDCKSPGKHPISKLVPNGAKNASNDPEQVGNWWKKHPSANIGIAMKEIWVVDVDGKKGMQSLEELEPLPPSTEVKTGKGKHIYFKGTIKKPTVKFDGIDLKYNGYVVAPPSKHISGKTYKWVRRFDEMVKTPDDLLAKLYKPRKSNATAASKIQFRKSSRNNSLASIAGSLRQRGLHQDLIAGCLHEINENACVPPLDEEEVERIATSVARYETCDFP